MTQSQAAEQLVVDRLLAALRPAYQLFANAALQGRTVDRYCRR